MATRPRLSLLHSTTDLCDNHQTTANISLRRTLPSVIASNYSDSEAETLSISCTSPPSAPPSLLAYSPRNKEKEYYEKDVVNQNGYQIIRKLNDTMQGQLLEASVLNSNTSEGSTAKKVIIKKVDRSLHFRHLGVAHNDNDDDDGMSFCVPNDIFKEALFLSHLTVSNRQVQIIQFVDFFYSQEHYYLVLEHLDDDCMNLKQFVEHAHSYIRNGQLPMHRYLQVIKFIFWQLLVLMEWMHSVMHCCHLDLKLEHVMLKNVEFVLDAETTSISVSQNIGVKLCDFGSAEIFGDGVFACDKRCSILREAQYQSPLLAGGQTYDARKADMWALGSMLFHCLMGQTVYRKLHQCEQIEKSVFGCLQAKHLRECADLILNMLRMNENERYLAMDALQHKWFYSYYRKYKYRIASKATQSKKKPNIGLNHFPYYDHSKMK